jgi:hypothetical protein
MAKTEELKLNGNEKFSNTQVSVILLRHSLHDGGVITKPGRVLIAEAVRKIDRHFSGKGPVHFQLSYSPTASKSGQRRAENTGLILQEGLTALPGKRFILEGVLMRKSLQGDPSFAISPKPNPRSSIEIAENIDRLTTSFLLLEANRCDLIKPGNQYALIGVTHIEVLIPWLRSHGAVFSSLEEVLWVDPIFVKLHMGKLKIDYPDKFP